MPKAAKATVRSGGPRRKAPLRKPARRGAAKAASAPARPAPNKQTRAAREGTAKAGSLYQRLGGKAAIGAAVEALYERVLADRQLKKFFRGAEMDRLKNQQKAFFTQALGGPARYRGPDMKQAHEHLSIESRHFERVVAHLAKSLSSLQAAPSLIDEVLSAVAPLVGDIVNTPSPAKASAGAAASQEGPQNPIKRRNTRMAKHPSGKVAVAEPPSLEESTSSAASEGQSALSMIENMPTAVIQADLDLTITYMNRASLDALKELEQHLPCRADEIVGQSIDIFHKNPSYQRKILSNPANLPHQATIEVGPEKLDLLVSAIRDDEGNYLGPMVTWEVITEKLQLEAEAARMQSMMDQSPINTMYADRDLVIRYMNPASSKTLKTLQQYLPVRVEDMIGQNIDVFHKNPAHQRNLLADPSNLPRQANITVGPETLDLLVSAIRDNDGKYIGAMVTWEVITERLKAAEREKEGIERERRQQEELSNKVNQMLEAVQEAMKGDLTVEVPVSGEDTIGQMGEGLQSLLTNMREVMQRFSENAQQVGSSSEELTTVSQQMSSNAEETSTQAAVVSAATEQVNKSVQVAATGTEEMSASIGEISKNSSEAAKVAKQAVTVADSANNTIKILGESSVEIGKVIKVITSIAQQTNLLALNATIEAARAGEAGKGFAVVANEVKELAKQTAQATEDISQKIEAIQDGSRGAVEAIAEVSVIIGQISDISNTIASAVEEQTTTTNEISRNVAEVARGSAEIAENISGVAQAADSTSKGANDTITAAKSLSKMATQLQELVGRFTI